MIGVQAHTRQIILRTTDAVLLCLKSVLFRFLCTFCIHSLCNFLTAVKIFKRLTVHCIFKLHSVTFESESRFSFRLLFCCLKWIFFFDIYFNFFSFVTGLWRSICRVASPKRVYFHWMSGAQWLCDSNVWCAFKWIDKTNSSCHIFFCGKLKTNQTLSCLKHLRG